MAEKTCNTAHEPAVRALISRHLNLSSYQLTPIPTYLDTIVYEIATETDTFVFKAIDVDSRDADSIALEAWAIKQAAAYGVPVPQVVLLDTAKEQFPGSYLIMKKAKGQPLSSLTLTPDEKQIYFRQLGDALRRLHAITLPGFGSLDEQMYRQQGTVRGCQVSWQDALLAPLPASIAYFSEHMLLSPADMQTIEQVIATMQQHLATMTHGSLLHGDLGPLHVWVNPTTQTLTSIIDFGERMVGDPLWDFVDYDWNDVASLWAEYTQTPEPSPIFGATFYGYALLRALPWAHKWHSRGAAHVLDWLKITLTRAHTSASGEV